VDHEEQAGGQGPELNQAAPPAAWFDFERVALDLNALLALAPTLPLEFRAVRLTELLNRLEIAVLGLPEMTPSGELSSVAPERREDVASAFPEFGWYSAVSPSSPDNEEASVVSDACDDLAEILRDVDCALLTAKSCGWIDGAWEARESYAVHMGRHLADLRSYIYYLRFAH
jgi:hypothetical protein